MDRDSLRRLIRSSIQFLAFEELKSHKANSAPEGHPMEEDNTSDDDIDTMLFYGGQVPDIKTKRAVTTIKEIAEPTEKLKITTTEIADFEKSFSNLIAAVPSASVIFDKQPNGYSLIAFKSNNAVEARASGTIDLGRDGKIVWSYSIQNGVTITAQNAKLEQSNKTIFEQISNNFDDFQTKWRKRLNLPAGADKEDNTVVPNSSTTPGEDAGSSGMEGGAGGANAPAQPSLGGSPAAGGSPEKYL